MRRISVSELITFADCRQKHHYRYSDRITLIGEGSSKMLAGTLVHQAVQNYVKLRDHRPLADHVVDMAVRLVADGMDKSKLSEAVSKATRLAQRFPQHYLDDPALVSEYQVEWQVDEDTMIFGIPDLLYMPKKDELEVWELKTTENAYKQPLDFLLWNPQHRYYATMMKSVAPELLVTFRYIVIGRDVCEQAFLFTDRSWRLTQQEIRGIISQMSSGVYPNYGTRCSWCEFHILCEGRMLGQDETSLRKEFYRER